MPYNEDTVMFDASLLLIFSTSFLVGLSGALTPGPLLMVSIAESARRGFWAGPLVAMGHSMLELVVVMLLAAGLSTILHGGPIVAGIGLLGGGFLIWMGQGMVRGAPRLSLSAALASTSARVSAGPLFLGMWASLANPYWILWWATVGASYTLWALGQGPTGLGYFYVGHILSDFAWYSLVSFLIATGRRLVSDALYRRVIVACGLFILGLGVYFIASGISWLSRPP